MKRILPPSYFLAAIVFMVALHFLFPIRRVLNFPWSLAGLVPLVVGCGFNLFADQRFKTNATTVKPFEKSSTLVTSGVFGISRNPMYLGMVLILLGIALLLGSATPFAGAVLLASKVHRSRRADA